MLTHCLPNQTPSLQKEGQCNKAFSTLLKETSHQLVSTVVLQQHEAAVDEVWRFQLLRQNKLSPGMLLIGLPQNKREIPRCAYEQVMLKNGWLCNVRVSSSLAVSLWSGLHAVLQMPGRLHNGDRGGCMHLPRRWTVVSSEYFLLPQEVSLSSKYHPRNCTWGQLHCKHKHHFVMCRRLYTGGSKHIYMQGIVFFAPFSFAGSVEFKSPLHAFVSFCCAQQNKKNKTCPTKYNMLSLLSSKSSY